MTPQQSKAACDLLYRHWLAGSQITGLPDELRPQTRAEGHTIQACIEKFSELPLFGWKLAATSKAGQEHIGVDGPLIGRILGERVIANGGTCTLGSNLMRVAELEFAFRFGEKILPSHHLGGLDEILPRVASLHPAIEIPDSRILCFENAGVSQLIADNACANRFVLGDACPEIWRTMDLANHPVTGLIDDGPGQAGIGSNVLGGPLIALEWFVTEMAELGMPIRTGQVVTTGTCLPPMAIAPGDIVVGDFGALGEVTLHIA